MKSLSKTKPVDVSKGLFMDLAFLLIAALVLLVREPAQSEARAEPIAGLPDLSLRYVGSQFATEIVEDDKIKGETLRLAIDKEGMLHDWRASDNVMAPLAIDALVERIGRMTEPEKWVVLYVDSDASYGQMAPVRDALEKLQADGVVTRTIEAVLDEQQNAK